MGGGSSVQQAPAEPAAVVPSVPSVPQSDDLGGPAPPAVKPGPALLRKPLKSALKKRPKYADSEQSESSSGSDGSGSESSGGAADSASLATSSRRRRRGAETPDSGLFQSTHSSAFGSGKNKLLAHAHDLHQKQHADSRNHADGQALVHETDPAHVREPDQDSAADDDDSSGGRLPGQVSPSGSLSEAAAMSNRSSRVSTAMARGASTGSLDSAAGRGSRVLRVGQRQASKESLLSKESLTSEEEEEEEEEEEMEKGEDEQGEQEQQDGIPEYILDSEWYEPDMEYDYTTQAPLLGLNPQDMKLAYQVQLFAKAFTVRELLEQSGLVLEDTIEVQAADSDEEDQDVEDMYPAAHDVPSGDEVSALEWPVEPPEAGPTSTRNPNVLHTPDAQPLLRSLTDYTKQRTPKRHARSSGVWRSFGSVAGLIDSDMMTGTDRLIPSSPVAVEQAFAFHAAAAANDVDDDDASDYSRSDSGISEQNPN